MPHLVLIYGPPMSGKSSVAREVAASLPGKTALVSIDSLLRDFIVVSDRDAVSELGMAHTQARLLVANYLKNGYHVVVEGAFYYERDGILHRHEHEIDQLVSLMRNLARSPLVVKLAASEASLRGRAEANGRPQEVESACRIAAAYRPRYGARTLEIETDAISGAEAAEQVKQRLEAEEFA